MVISKLEPVDTPVELPSKQETRLVKSVGKKAVANFRIKQEVENSRPGRQSARSSSYADLEEVGRC